MRSSILLPHAGITRWRRRVVFLPGRSEQFGEYGLEGIGPDLIALESGMEAVGIHHAGEEPAIFVRELVIDVDEADLPAVAQFRDVLVDLVDRRHNGDVVVARKDRR